MMAILGEDMGRNMAQNIHASCLAISPISWKRALVFNCQAKLPADAARQVTSILSTLKALFWALLLLFLIIYIFALLFTCPGQMRRFRMQLHVGPSVNNKMISCATLRHADDYIHIMHERCFVRGLMRSWGPYTTSLAAHRDAQLKVDLAGLDHLTSKIAFLQVPHCHRSVHWIDSPEHQTLQGCLS